jgi:hypothetical protein
MLKTDHPSRMILHIFLAAMDDMQINSQLMKVSFLSPMVRVVDATLRPSVTAGRQSPSPDATEPFWRYSEHA